MKTIFNTYVEVTSQEQADRLKQICIDNGLLKSYLSSDFSFYGKYKNFTYDESNTFYIAYEKIGKIKVTESEWLELLKQHQCTE